MSKSSITLPLLLKQLRLPGMGVVWEEISKRARQEQWSYERYLSILCEHELDQKHQNRIQKYKKEAHLPVGKTLSSFEAKTVGKGDWKRLESLCEETSWLTQGHNVLLFGPSGVGKTHLAAALGHQLVLQGQRVLFTSTTAMVQRLQQAHQNLALIQEVMKLDRYALLILDDIGYVRKEDQEMHVLFELITHRYEHRSLAITSNQPFKDWDKIFKDQAMTVAAVDRLIHHGFVFEIKGESYRRRQALAQNNPTPVSLNSSSPSPKSSSEQGENKEEKSNKNTTTKKGEKAMT